MADLIDRKKFDKTMAALENKRKSLEMKTVWSCKCGYPEYELEDKESSMPSARIGSVVQCRGCKEVFANVYAMGGPHVWVRVDPDEASFNRLIKSKSELEWMNED